MSISIGSGISFSGVQMGQVPFYPPRLAGAASTNTAQTWSVAQGSPLCTTAVAPMIGSTCGDFTATPGPQIRTTSPTPTFTNFAGGDWTFEAWIYMKNKPAAAAELTSTEVSNGMGVRLGQRYNGPINYISIYGRNANDMNYAPWSWVTNQWTYFAIQRSGTNVSFWAANQGAAVANYIGGTQYTTSSAGTATFANATSSGCYIGGNAGSTTSIGSYVNMMVWSNVARYGVYNAPIPVPYAFYPIDTYTTQSMQFQGTDGGAIPGNTTS